MDKKNARDLQITFDILMNYIWYKKRFTQTIRLDTTTCYLLIKKPKTWITDVLNGADDENGENQQSKEAAVLVLPDSVNGVPDKRQLYLTTIS